MVDANDDWCQSPRPMNDAAESDGVEEWIASPRNEVAAEPAATVATELVDAATTESTGSVAAKKRRLTQQVLQWGTPPPKPVAPPPRPTPPPIRPLSDEEKKEKAYRKAQKSYTSDWLPKFDWLILDRTPEVTEEVDRVVSLIEHRYIDYEGAFGAGLSTHLSPFMARLKNGDNKVKVDGVDASGRPVRHTFELNELPDKKHKFGGSLADCVKMGKAFAREVVYNLKHRMRDLRRMGGMKLFRVDKWPSNPDTRARRCATWLPAPGFVTPGSARSLAPRRSLALKAQSLLKATAIRPVLITADLGDGNEVDLGGSSGGDLGGDIGGDLGSDIGGDLGGGDGGDLGGGEGGDLGGGEGGDLGGGGGGDLGGGGGGYLGGGEGGDLGGGGGGDLGGGGGGNLGGGEGGDLDGGDGGDLGGGEGGGLGGSDGGDLGGGDFEQGGPGGEQGGPGGEQGGPGGEQGGPGGEQGGPGGEQGGSGGKLGGPASEPIPVCQTACHPVA
ncbi:unnamed protein product [Closterium sp. NIES-64]|nr:unnamed protein product [Closterium sp. NIES-64]